MSIYVFLCHYMTKTVYNPNSQTVKMLYFCVKNSVFCGIPPILFCHIWHIVRFLSVCSFKLPPLKTVGFSKKNAFFVRCQKLLFVILR